MIGDHIFAEAGPWSVMEDEEEKEKKPWKCLDDLKKKFISKKLLFCVNIAEYPKKKHR